MIELHQHTNEPWSINEWTQPDSSIAIGAIGTPLIARIILRDVSINEQKANVRRIVACVNACAGLTTAELELAAIFGERLQAKLVGAKYKQQRDALVAAIQQTLDENGHLADGDNCTLIVLKRALESVGAAQVVNCSTCRFRETKEPCRGCYEYHAWQPKKFSRGDTAGDPLLNNFMSIPPIEGGE